MEHRLSWRLLGGALALAVFALTACGDNFHPGGGSLLISPQIDLRTSENGGTATFTVQLTNEPAGDVTVDVTSMNMAEGTVSPARLMFDRGDFDTPQTVTLIGVNDDRADGNQAYIVRVEASRLGEVDLEVVNQDDDTAGFSITPLLGLSTSEAGASAAFDVRLTSRPAADVMVPIASADASEGIADKTGVTFTPTNWDTPQRITVTGQQDTISDGTVTYVVVLGVAMSADDDYGGLDPDDVTLQNIDDDTRGIAVTGGPLSTSESGTTDSFTVVLQSQPSASVTVAVTSSDTTEATLSTASLVFTSANWNQAQTVTVTGVDDLLADNDQPFTIVLGAATSADTMYAGIDPNDVTGVNTDNDIVGIIVAPTTTLTTSETGTTDSFTVVLGSQPTANVTIAVSSSDTTEATVSTASLVFTTANWNQAQTVTVTGVDDAIDDNDQPFTVVLGAAVSTDTTYNGMNPADLAGVNVDNDAVAIIVTPTSGLVTSETGTSDGFTVVLGSQPTADVTIGVSSSDTTEGSVTPTALVFTPANWNQPQTVTVIGADDLLADGPIAYTVILAAAASADPAYNTLDPTDVAVTNTDNDVAGVTVEPINGLVVSEFQDTDTFTIVLNAAPTANVTITLMSSNMLEGTVLPTSVLFTPQNWFIPQTVTVTGVNDSVADGNILFTIITDAASSTDPAYNGLAVPDVEVLNIDNDTAQVYVKARRRLQVSESGQSATFRVRLTVAPTATVTCTLMSSDTSEGSVSPTTLMFTPGNFGFQNVTVTGVEDTIVDGDVLFTILMNACTSTDPQYNGSNPRDVSAINRDND